MFCTQCGKPAAPEHNFCAGCGTRLALDAPAEVAPSMAVGGAPALSGTPLEDWRTTTRYRAVLAHPEVQALIADASRASKAGMSADEFMKLAQPVLDAAGSGGIPIKLIAEIAAPLYARMGVKTGKDAKNGYATPFGRVLAAILCSLASRNQRLIAIEEGADGCVVLAQIPASMTTWTGQMTLSVERKPEGTLVSSAVVFQGQSSDWGRARRVLDDLHQDILNYRTLQP